MLEIAPGIFRWTARHPEWHPGDWGAEVACFAVREPGRTLLVDPLVDGSWDALDGLVHGDVETLITIPYHVRSAGECAERYGGSIWGHRACLKRLAQGDPLRELSPETTPAGVRPTVIGKPRRHEMPLLIESCGALCFGDALVGVPGSEGPLRIWFWSEYSNAWYRRRFLPSLEPLKELDVRAVLVTHGDSVVKNARAELRRGLERESWYHRSG